MMNGEGCSLPLVPLIAVSYVKQLHSWPEAAGGSVLVQGYKLTIPPQSE
jgi:hypothetical protein